MGEDIPFSPKSVAAFLATAELGGVRQAAEHLGLSQPAISRIIQRLEQQLQVRLFERLATGMLLTPYGRALLPYARALRREGQHAVEHVDALRGLRRGTVRIGSIASATREYLPYVIQQTVVRYPQFKYDIIESTEDQLIRALLDLELDLAIFGSEPNEPNLTSITTQEMGDEYVLIAAPDHPVFDHDEITYDFLRNFTWAMPKPGTLPREQFEFALDSAGMEHPAITVETRSVSAIKGLVSSGGFVGWLPLPLVSAEIVARLIRVVPFEPLQLRRRFHCYRANTRVNSPTATEFIQILSACDFSDLRTRSVLLGS